MSRPGFVVCRGGIYPSRGHSGCRKPAGTHICVPYKLPGIFVGAAYMPPGPCTVAKSCPGGINPSPTKASLVKGRWPEGPEGFRRASPGCPSHPQTARNPSASLRSAPAPLLALRATSPGAGESVFAKGGFFYTTPTRGPLCGGSRFGWYRKIIRKWLVYPRVTRSCGICGRRS